MVTVLLPIKKLLFTAAIGLFIVDADLVKYGFNRSDNEGGKCAVPARYYSYT